MGAGFKETSQGSCNVLRMAMAGALTSPGLKGPRKEKLLELGESIFQAEGRELPDGSCGPWLRDTASSWGSYRGGVGGINPQPDCSIILIFHCCLSLVQPNQGQGVWKLIDAVQVVSLRGGAEQDGKAESGPGEASSRWSANVSTELSLSASAQSQQLITEWILYPCPF